MRTVITVVLVAVFGGVVAGDAAAAWPFRQIWEKRRAELYAELSRDVTRKVNVRVEAAKQDLEESLAARVADEAAQLDAQARADAAELENLFDQ
jgi:hypothetical protein